MTQLLLFILATAGLTTILVRSKIFKPVREYLTTKKITLLDCGLCTGVYVSSIVYYLEFQRVDTSIILYTFAGAIVSNLLISLIQYLDRK